MSATPTTASASPTQPIYILDTSAILRYLDRESGWPRVHFVLDERSAGHCRVLLSAVNWGELGTKLYRRNSPELQTATMTSLLTLGIEIIPATADRAFRCGQIKARLSIPYADSFGVELAHEFLGSLLITADFDVKPAASEIQIEFLPTK